MNFNFFYFTSANLIQYNLINLHQRYTVIYIKLLQEPHSDPKYWIITTHVKKVLV